MHTWSHAHTHLHTYMHPKLTSNSKSLHGPAFPKREPYTISWRQDRGSVRYWDLVIFYTLSSYFCYLGDILHFFILTLLSWNILHFLISPLFCLFCCPTLSHLTCILFWKYAALPCITSDTFFSSFSNIGSDKLTEFLLNNWKNGNSRERLGLEEVEPYLRNAVYNTEGESTQRNTVPPNSCIIHRNDIQCTGS